MSTTPRRALALVAAIVVALAVGFSYEPSVGWTRMLRAIPGAGMLEARCSRVRAIVDRAHSAVPLLRPRYTATAEDIPADFNGPLRDR